MSRSALDPRRVRAVVGLYWQNRSAIRQARHFRRIHPSAVCVCWDLDNTLVDSGTLIRGGAQLREAIVDAAPVPNMLEFYKTVVRRLPAASHFILTARPSAMRTETLAWLAQNGVACAETSVCFLPHAHAKPRVWQRLSIGAPVVIVDDLSYDHERPDISLYADLVTVARKVASVYVGLDEILRIAADADEVEPTAALIASAVAEDVRRGTQQACCDSSHP